MQWCEKNICFLYEKQEKIQTKKNKHCFKNIYFKLTRNNSAILAVILIVKETSKLSYSVK